MDPFCGLPCQPEIIIRVDRFLNANEFAVSVKRQPAFFCTFTNCSTLINLVEHCNIERLGRSQFGPCNAAYTAKPTATITCDMPTMCKIKLVLLRCLLRQLSSILYTQIRTYHAPAACQRRQKPLYIKQSSAQKQIQFPITTRQLSAG